jgi:hypothetical protein
MFELCKLCDGGGESTNMAAPPAALLSCARPVIRLVFVVFCLLTKTLNCTTKNISAAAEAKRKLMPESVGDSCGKADGTRWRELQAGSELCSNPDI